MDNKRDVSEGGRTELLLYSSCAPTDKIEKKFSSTLCSIYSTQWYRQLAFMRLEPIDKAQPLNS